MGIKGPGLRAFECYCMAEKQRLVEFNLFHFIIVELFNYT